ncbi:MAG: hypothetical protein M3209_21125 [Acidobacteriota bacterium]|nr:hypothetical protein [Acidobacteriota bacterium]
MNKDEFYEYFDDEFVENELGEDFDSEDEFDESDLEIELTNIKRRTVILTKKDMIAVLGVQTFDQGGTICRVDPREERPAVQLYDNPEDALDWFKRSLRTSRQNGWQVVYDGLPLHG